MEIQKLTSVQDLRLQHEVHSQRERQSDFSSVLRDGIEKGRLQFSKHAAARMNERGVEMTPALARDLNAAVDKAREKGAKDVVVIGPQNAFIVSVTNNTVVTTMNAQEMKSNIFTNIDSAVLL